MMVHGVTAAARMRSRYGVHVRNAFLAALAIHLLIFCFFPDFEIKPYVLSETVEFEFVVPDDIEIPPPPPEVAQPHPNIVPADNGQAADDIYIPLNVPAAMRELPPLRLSPVESHRDFYPFDEAPVLLTFVGPVYPGLARDAGIEGTVLLRVLVGVDGKVLTVDILRSDVTPAMESAAAAAARRFEFKPAMQGTVPVRAYVAVPVAFKLR